MATPVNWVGTYNDNNYGGFMSVCVSLVNGTYYGQASFSQVGYMRGTIDAVSLTWSGNFWTAGLEVKQGTFALTLDNTGTSFSGTFTENPSITYAASSTQLSSQTPSDLNCMKSEDYLLTTTDFYNFNGVWYEPVLDLTSSMFVNQTLQQVTGSYYYNFYGVHYGMQYHQPLLTLNGQLTAGNWYEGEGFMGMEMYVAKNATTAYATYWTYDKMADFDYNAQVGNTFYQALAYTYLLPDHGTPTYTEAAANTCYMTPTWKTFNWCETGFANDGSGSDSNSSDSLSGGQTAGIVIGVFVALAIGVVVGFFLGKRSASAPMASREENKPASEMASRA